ncbi:MAG: hypothetical protein Q9178_000239 [Gyalolechia marmorata]
MTSPLPIQRPRTPSDTYLANEAPLSPNSESKHGSLRRRPSFSFLRRSKSREGPSRTISGGTNRSSSGGAVPARKLSKKQRALSREQEMRQENIPTQAPKIPDIPRIHQLQEFGGENRRPDSVAIISRKADGYRFSQTGSLVSRETLALAGPHNIPVPPIPTDYAAAKSPVDLFMQTGSIAHRGRSSYASSMVSTINSPRRLRKRKDPTPFKYALKDDLMKPRIANDNCSVLVVGARNSGKTSFLEFLRTSLALSSPKKRAQSHADGHDVPSASSTVGYPNFTPHYLETELGTERIGVTLWDSQGLERNMVDLQLREMSSFVESKFEETFTEENRVVRTPGFKDTHIHCVFLVLDPARLDANVATARKVDGISGAEINGNSLARPHAAALSSGLDENLDLQVLRAFQSKTTVIPVVAKADTITTAHMAFLKRAVWDSIKRANLDKYETIGLGESADEESSEDEQIYGKASLPVEDRKRSDTSHLDSPSDSDASGSSSGPDLTKRRKTPAARKSQTPSPPVPVAMRPQSPAEIPYLPLSVISPDLYEADVPGRRFPWGFADPYNAEHCDFVRLRDMIFSEWREDLREASREIGYEGWRTSRLNRQSARGEPRSPPRGQMGYAR